MRCTRDSAWVVPSGYIPISPPAARVRKQAVKASTFRSTPTTPTPSPARRGILLPVHGDGAAREQEACDERVPEERGGGQEVHLSLQRGGHQERVDEVVRVIDAEEHRPDVGDPVGDGARPPP